MEQGHKRRTARAPRRRPDGQLRIIGGAWRSRKLPVADLDGLRPTGDRLRETLFNWLQGDVSGARCLDLFAGTGALGFEALSRGARHCDFVEIQAPALAQLYSSVALLGCEDRAAIRAGHAFEIIPTLEAPCDIVFLDPPFSEQLHAEALDRLSAAGLLRSGALVYLEYPKEQELDVKTALDVLRDKSAGGVNCTLARVR